MPTLGAIVSFLSRAGELAGDVAPSPALAESEITGIRVDSEAGPGELAWVSAKRLASDPARLERFSGSLLLCPAGSRAPLSTTRCLAPCNSPKLAVIRVIEEFFADRAATGWPRLGGEPIAADASIAEGVVLGHGVVIGPGVAVEPNVEIGPNTVVAWTRIAGGARIGANCAIGLPGFGYEKDAEGRFVRFPHVGGVVIEERVEIGSCVCVDRGSIGDTVIRRHAKVDNLVHVAHNVDIGENSLVIANSMLGGSARIAADAWVAPSVSIMNQAAIGRGAVIGMGAVVLKDVEAGAVMVGNPAKPLPRKR